MNANQIKSFAIVIVAYLIGGKDAAAAAISTLTILAREQAPRAEQPKPPQRKRRARKRNHKQLELPLI